MRQTESLGRELAERIHGARAALAEVREILLEPSASAVDACIAPLEKAIAIAKSAQDLTREVSAGGQTELPGSGASALRFRMDGLMRDIRVAMALMDNAFRLRSGGLRAGATATGSGRDDYDSTGRSAPNQTPGTLGGPLALVG